MPLEFDTLTDTLGSPFMLAESTTIATGKFTLTKAGGIAANIGETMTVEVTGTTTARLSAAGATRL